MRTARLLSLGVALLCAPAHGRAEPMSADRFRSELVGMPLCGTPSSGPLIGKPLCTVHHVDGSAVVAGSGVLIRGIWDTDGDRICRRSASDPLERRRCVEYEKIGEGRFKNSDGIEFCLGPCGQ